MNLIDLVILKRLMSRIGLMTLLLFGLAALVESLNTWRFEYLSSAGGPLLGVAAIAATALLWSLNTLPVALLVGAIVALLDLEAHGELTVIRSTGMSVWRMLRAPLIATVVGIGAAAIATDTLTVVTMRGLNLMLPAPGAEGPVWLEQRWGEDRYVLSAEHALAGGQVLEGVTFFLPRKLGGPRVHAPRAELRGRAWYLGEGVSYSAEAAATAVNDLTIPTESTPGDLGARLAAPADLTLSELLRIASLPHSDTKARSPVLMRLAKLLVLPFALGAALVIAFAFTTGYGRRNKHGTTVLYGIVLGFVVYLVMEMAAIAGSAGILQPALAAFAPAFVAMVVGTTVLLFREDGRR
jgi:lipopolysaccharide export system permease protein